MPEEPIETLEKLHKIHKEFREEDKKLIEMVVSASAILEQTRQELNNDKKNYQKSIYPIIKDNFRAILVFLSLILLLIAGIFIPAHFKIEIGSLKIEKNQTCKTQD